LNVSLFSILDTNFIWLHMAMVATSVHQFWARASGGGMTA